MVCMSQRIRPVFKWGILFLMESAFRILVQHVGPQVSYEIATGRGSSACGQMGQGNMPTFQDVSTNVLSFEIDSSKPSHTWIYRY